MPCAFHIVAHEKPSLSLSGSKAYSFFYDLLKVSIVNVLVGFLSTHRPFFFYDVLKVDRDTCYTPKRFSLPYAFLCASVSLRQNPLIRLKKFTKILLPIRSLFSNLPRSLTDPPPRPTTLYRKQNLLCQIIPIPITE